MIWNQHNNLIGKHAFLSPSGYHWINYDISKLETTYRNKMRIEEGTELHAIASDLIKHGLKLAKYKKTLNMFVNDCIALNMNSEQILYYSNYCFGTADAISFNGRKLKIFDLKTGTTKASFNQLDIYAALFCLEYTVSPNDIQIEERIYQNNTIEENQPSADDILYIMGKIVDFDQKLQELSDISIK